MKIWLGAQFQCRHLQEGRGLRTCSRASVELLQNYKVGQQRQWKSEMQFNKFPNPTIILGVQKNDSKIKWILFGFSIGCHVIMDQRSGDGRFFGRLKILVIICWKELFRRLLLLWTRSSRIPSSRRRSVSRNRKPQKRTMEVRSLTWSSTSSGFWCSWYTIGLCWYNFLSL